VKVHAPRTPAPRAVSKHALRRSQDIGAEVLDRLTAVACCDSHEDILHKILNLRLVENPATEKARQPLANRQRGVSAYLSSAICVVTHA
jgi:hypothetical protein